MLTKIGLTGHQVMGLALRVIGCALEGSETVKVIFPYLVLRME